MERMITQPMSVPQEGSIYFQIPFESFREVPQGVRYELDPSRSYYMVKTYLGKLDEQLILDYFDRVKLIMTGQDRKNGKIKKETEWALIDLGGGDFLVYTDTGLAVYSYNYERCLILGTELYEKYRKLEDISEPHFRLITQDANNYDSEEVLLKQPHVKTDEELVMHYPEGIMAYRNELFGCIMRAKSGIHILLGDPGTGKTSFIRYVVEHFSTRKGTKFYFIPPQYYSFLGSTKLLDFLRTEHSDYDEDTQLVLILEDSEALLRPREDSAAGAFSISELLNISDGLLGEGLDLQFICTINCPLKELDPAITRAGRMLSSHQFLPLNMEKARALAQYLNRDLIGEKRGGITLAEVYHTKVKGLAPPGRLGF